MERIVKLNLSESHYSTYADMYKFNGVPAIADLKEDYWQAIQMMPSTGKFVCFEELLNTSLAKDGVTWIRTINSKEEPARSIVASCCEEGEATVNLSSSIRMFIIFPDWNTYDMTVMVDGVEKIKIHSDNKMRSRYIPAFCYDVLKNKLYKTEGYKASYNML